MKLCKNCENRGRKKQCEIHTIMSNYAEQCKDFKENKQTNADRIRNMTDEELAEFIERIKNTCIVDAFGGEKMCETKAEVECKACKMKMGSILNWLKSEVKGIE